MTAMTSRARSRRPYAVHRLIDCGRDVAVIRYECGKWGITVTLAEWSNLASVTESARLHLGNCDQAPGDSGSYAEKAADHG